MSPQLPSFLRRRLRLSEARRVLLSGEPEQALDRLEDRSLGGVAEAERLLATVLDLLCRRAAQLHGEGEAGEAARLFARVAHHDPERAALWRRRLEEEQPVRSASSPQSAPGVLTALQGLLSELRDERGQRRGPRSRSSHGSLDSRLRAAASALVAGGAERPVSFRLGAPGVPEHLVGVGPVVSLGGGLGCLRSLLSFHGGPGWLFIPPPENEVELGGRRIARKGVELVDGEELRFASGASLIFHAPVAGSGTAVVHGSSEPAGGILQRVVLLSPGREHALRLAASGGHLVVPELVHPVELFVSEGRLHLECSLPACPAGETCAAARSAQLPLLAPLELSLCASPTAAAPRLALRPATEEASGA